MADTTMLPIMDGTGFNGSGLGAGFIGGLVVGGLLNGGFGGWGGLISLYNQRKKETSPAE